MRTLLKGFTLIELLIVVAIIALLITVAYPAYLDYTVRAKTSELILEASNFKTRVSEKAYAASTLASAGVGLTVTPWGKITGGSIADNGTITIIGSLATVGADVAVILTPAMTGGVVVWSCGAGTPETRRYLPAECRN